jgi:hypothetical protein
MTLGSTQPLTEMSARSVSWGGGGVKAAGARADNLSTFMNRLFRNSGSLNLLESYGPDQTCNGIVLSLSGKKHTHTSNRISSVPIETQTGYLQARYRYADLLVD